MAESLRKHGEADGVAHSTMSKGGKLTTLQCGRATILLVAAWAAIPFGATSASAQTSVKALFEKHKLLGNLAWDCGKPASPSNLYFVIRPLDDNHVQIDQMNGPTSREYLMLIDKTAESKPGELSLGGTRSDKPIMILWRSEADRVVRLDFSVDGKKLHAGGRYTHNSNQVPALRRCGG